jgi:uncharacterized protein YbaP (TraB family)
LGCKTKSLPPGETGFFKTYLFLKRIYTLSSLITHTRMKKTLAITCVALIIFVSSVLAQNLPKTLLWKITGNGLEKPSFLYGTMHLYDPRLFNLGDSLLYAIKSSEGFANEVDFNQITPMMVEIVKQEINNSMSLKEMLNKKTFEKYGPALSKKLNKPADEITSLDVLKEKNKWITEKYNGKKMQTFLDAYLADLANRQGKWLGGVEDFSDQSGLINTLIDESDVKQLAIGAGSGGSDEMNDMISLYQNSDLGGLQKMFSGMDSSYRDLLLIKRNKKMSHRIDSLVRIRSTVFAVGAAHLPGEEGLIDLLIKKGYTISPVFSSRKIEPKDYYIPEVEKQWVQIIDPEGHYQVEMPGIPGDVRYFGVLSMKMYFNIFNSTCYMTACTSLPYDTKGIDSVSKVMLRQFFGTEGYKQEKLLSINEIPGKSYVQKSQDGYKKVYMLYKNSLLYYAFGFSSSDTLSAVKAIDKFFDSYKVLPVKTDQAAGHFEYTDPLNAYKIYLPVKPKPLDRMTGSDNSTLKVNLMISSDPQTGSYYIFGPTVVLQGFALQNDSTTFITVHDNLLSKTQNVTRDTSYMLDGMRILEINGSMANGAMLTRAKIILRGNRYYTLLVMYGPGKWNSSAEEALSSFQVINYSFNEWSMQTSPDSLFSTWAPGKFSFFKETKDSSKITNTENISSFDSSSCNTYSLKEDTLEKYYWAKDDSTFWNRQKNYYLSKSDTILSERIFKKDGLCQYEIFKKPKGAYNILRMQMLLRGNRVYRLVTVQEAGTIRDENVNRYFDLFHFNNPSPKSEAFKSKADILLKDLQSPNSSIRRQANAALADAPFVASDLPQLQEAILQKYPVDSSLYRTVNLIIAKRITQLNDSSSLEFAYSHYNPTSQSDVRQALLYIVSSFHSKANYESLGKLLMSVKFSSSLLSGVTDCWDDSLVVSASLFPTILPLLKDSNAICATMDIASNLLDSNLISIAIFAPWQKTILDYANARFAKIKRDTADFDISDYSVINLLKRFKNEPCNAMLQKWLLVKGNMYHKQQIVLALLENGQLPLRPAIMELAATDYTRIQLYEHLKKYRKSNLFPVKYLTQSYFAESLAGDAIADFSDEYADRTFIKVREMKWKGKLYRFFFYDVYIEEDDEHWLVVSGPFSRNVADFSYSGSFSRVLGDEQYDVSKFNNQAKQLIQLMENKQ